MVAPPRRFWQVKQEPFEKKDTVPRVLAQRVKITMRDEIRRIEAKSRRLDPDWKDRDAMTDEVVTFAKRFLTQLPAMGAYNGSEQPGSESQFQFGDNSGQMSEILSIVDRSVLGPGITPASGGHFG